METAVKFFTEQSADEAVALAKESRQPLLIDYWATNCKGCAKMDAVTYEDAAVRAYLEQHYVVLKCHVSNIPKAFADTFLTTAMLWSPSLFIYAPGGPILRTIIGYAAPHYFMTELSLGKAALLIRNRKYQEAIDLLTTLPYAAEYPALHQEALYWCGVAAYFAGPRTFDPILPYWGELRKTYPESVWAEKADLFPGVI
ncbi:thioredoxin family protein [Chitinophaga solisilvae]|uniref:thioredoxin family protein n=1 Tax=Chitinophaga solisilvae TaxID=1233460 RepID=UPI00136AA1B1|nr:thioredoxin family protein [Chitinophaga solisilvae]